MDKPIENLSRRRFVQGFGAVGGALLLGISLPGTARAAQSDAPFEPDVFISIDHTGLVSIISHRSEMGQGVRSTLPLLVADEMEADWSRVKIVQAVADEKYGSQNTDGSRSVRKHYHRLRQAGATARWMLRQAAAQLWQVSPQQCEVYNHKVTDKVSGKQLDFADLVAVAKTLALPELDKLQFKPDSQMRYIGKDDIPLADGIDLVTGKAEYGYDVELPGQKYAVIARPPVVFGKVKRYNADAAMKVPGVLKVIQLDSLSPPALFKPLGGIAVVAENTWAATKGRDALEIEWDDGPNGHFSTREQEKAFAKSLDNPPKQIRQRGDWAHAVKTAAKQLEAEYYSSGLSHSMMEPPAAAAQVIDGHVHVWGCTQTPQVAQKTVAEVLGIQPSDVTVNVTYLGGGFGRKSKPDYMAEAAILARQTQWPVKMVWTREDEIRHGYYHSPSLQRVSATLDAQGNTTGWHHSMVMHPIGWTFNQKANAPGFENSLGLADLPYNIPNILIDNGETETHQRIGWLRSVANISNFFAVGSFIDEIAHAAGRDPKEHLLAMIGKDARLDFAPDGFKYGNYGESLADFPVDTARLKGVIELVAQKADWGRKLPKGHGLGIAAHRSFLTYVATVVEVSIKDGKVNIERIDSAVDCGKILNPDRVRAQMEGAAAFAASFTLYGEITLKDGRVEQGNFDDYPIARIGDIPDTHIYLMPSNERPSGIGEPGVPPFAPALCNAIVAAGGKRYRRLPLSQFGIV